MVFSGFGDGRDTGENLALPCLGLAYHIAA
jgi:hypothetical protein